MCKTLSLVAVTTSGAAEAVNVNVTMSLELEAFGETRERLETNRTFRTASLEPSMVAVAVNAPTELGVAITEAWPFAPVTTLLLEKASPAPEKFTCTYGMGLLLESVTSAISA